MKTHTPGPFPLKITQADDFFVIITNQGNHYAKTFDPAAAHLIASAPELLSALKRLTDCLSEDPNDYPDSSSARQVFDSIRSAREIINRIGGNL
jgi:hypothetical protein